MTYPPPSYEGYSTGPVPDRRGDVFGWVALGLGITSLVLCCVWAGIWAGLPAIVLAILGMTRPSTNRWASVTGLVLAILALLLTVVAVILIGSINWEELQRELENNNN